MVKEQRWIECIDCVKKSPGGICVAKPIADRWRYCSTCNNKINKGEEYVVW